MAGSVNPKNLQTRLLCPEQDLSFKLLEEDPDSWIRNHNADIAAITTAYSQELPSLAHANFPHLLFQVRVLVGL